jgi:eukaryotic-like serine/threonine-protein kinase
VQYNFFRRKQHAEPVASEFAATVASMPVDLDDRSWPGDTPPWQGAHRGGLLTDSLTENFAGLSFLDSPGHATPEAATSTTLSQVGRYTIKGQLGQLGQGGLGQVHEAWDPLLSRTVALKTLHVNLDPNLAPEARAALDTLFLNEARAAAGLNHPHIVTVYDAGVAPQGVYIAMERLHGRDLRDALAQGWHPTPVQAAQLVRRVADALAYAHARGVVHCDVKPANIFLDAENRPKVLDFGIARVAHHGLGASDLHDPLSPILGSPYYLAPEQLEGGVVDARTDIHGLGLVLYELLTGRKAFAIAGVPDEHTPERIAQAVLSGHIPQAHLQLASVPLELSAIAARAMALYPADRYSQASELAQELRRWAEQQADTDATLPSALPFTLQPTQLSSALAVHNVTALAGAEAATATVATSSNPDAPAASAPTRQSHQHQALKATALLLALGAVLSWVWSSQQAEVPPTQVIKGAVSLQEAALPNAVSVPATLQPAPVVALAADAPASAAAAVANEVAAPAASAAGLALSAGESVVPAKPAPALTTTLTPAAAASPSPSTATPPLVVAAKPAPPKANATEPRADPRTEPRTEPRTDGRPAPAAATPRAAAPAGTGTGTLQLAISPWGQVEVDGTRVGTTPPLTRLSLPAGTHTVTVRNDDAAPYTVTVQVLADKAVVVRHNFAP